MHHSTERLARYLVVKGEIRRETYLEIKNLDPWAFVALYVYAIALRRKLRGSKQPLGLHKRSSERKSGTPECGSD